MVSISTQSKSKSDKQLSGTSALKASPKTASPLHKPPKKGSVVRQLPAQNAETKISSIGSYAKIPTIETQSLVSNLKPIKIFKPIPNKLEHPELVRMISRQKEKNVTKRSKLASLLYDKEAGKFLDRTKPEWIRGCTYYLIYYFLLFGLTILLMAFVLNVIIDSRFPSWMGPSAILGFCPNLKVLAPALSQISPKAPIIRYTRNDSKSYEIYVKSLRNILCDYKKRIVDNKTIFDCKDKRMYACKSLNDMENSCAFDVGNSDTAKGLGPCFCKGGACEKSNFGYEINQACVAISINKMFNWIPEEFSADSITGPEHLFDCTIDRILFFCHGRKSMDDEHFKNVEVYPSQGMAFCYFPFYNQKTYQQPFFMIRLIEPKPGTFIEIECHGSKNNLQPQPETGGGTVEIDFFIN